MDVSLVGAVFDETDCHVFEAYSRYDRDVRCFASLEEIRGALEVGTDRPTETRMVLLDLWSPSTGGEPTIRRRELKVQGASFRYEVSGWGLFRLQLGGSGDNVVRSSWFAHNTEKRAQRWSDTIDCLGTPDVWNWDEVTVTGRRVVRHIRNRLAVEKLPGAEVVLPEAKQLRSAGWDLRL
jgi:hypothetical protein